MTLYLVKERLNSFEGCKWPFSEDSSCSIRKVKTIYLRSTLHALLIKLCLGSVYFKAKALQLPYAFTTWDVGVLDHP